MYGSKLKEVRKFLSLTQEEMASLLNISYRTYAAYERNENNPPYSILAELCRKYKIDLNWFIADEGAMLRTAGEGYGAVKDLLLADVKNMLAAEGIMK